MKDELISRTAFAKATHLKRFKIAANALMSISGIHKINKLYANAIQEEHADFIESIFQQLSVRIVFNEKELERIPKTGPFITVSNHPFGAIDGLLLIYLVTKVRPDFKVMANFLLKEIEPIADSFISVNPFEDRKDIKSSYSGIKEAIKHLKEGHGIGLFPAGEVSTFHSNKFHITDKNWNKSAIHFIQKAQVPIIPIHFNGSNSLLFHLLGIIHPSLRTLALPSEMLKKRHSSICVRVGKKISQKEQLEWDDADQFSRFLRAKTYSLESAIEVKKFFVKQTDEPPLEAQDIVPEIPKQHIIDEIRNIQDLKVSEQAEFEIYASPANRIPNILNEIGRLREITFRAVGEGSNQERDLDEYDLYYHHLFLWDKQNQQIAGAYRLGKGDEIFAQYGQAGFYLQSLFKIKDDFNPILQKSIEMGRSFVVEEYQQKRLPLFLLWQGIVEFIFQNDNYQYLMGPVSISNDYSKLSRMLIVEFIKRFYYDNSLAAMVKPRKKFKVKFRKIEADKLLENTKDVKKFDQLISDIEPNHAPIPVLIKKYLKQNAKIIGFNLDPIFNNALDGFMILDLNDLPKESIKNLKKKLT